MKRFYCIIVFIFYILIFNLQAKEIAFTFDDAPRPDSVLFNGQQRAHALIGQLIKGGIQKATFFLNTSRLNIEGRERIQSYVQAGHSIGNHTHTHPDINSTDINDYLEDIFKAHNLAKEISGFTPYFRFPYLREGDTVEKRDRVRQEIKKLSLKNAYVTVDNYDWYMDSLLQKALKDGKIIDFEKLKKVYLEVLIACVESYDSMAMEGLGRSPKHVLLLHENDINALFVGDLSLALQERGWKIISPEEAYEDEISNYSTPNIFKWNPGRIGEIAEDNGLEKNKWWHESCDEDYLEELFMKEKIVTDSITFTPVEKNDFIVLYDWLRVPHVAKWWYPDLLPWVDFVKKYEKSLNSDFVRGYFIKVNKKAIGFIQSYDANKIPDAKGEKDPIGTWGMDLYIADSEYLGKGFGVKILISFMEKLTKENDVKKFVIDPHIDNKIAIRTYEKVGFIPVREEEGYDENYGKVLIMEKILK